MSGHNGKVLERSQTTGCDVTAVVQRGPVGLGAIRPRAMRRELQLRLALLEADWRHRWAAAQRRRSTCCAAASGGSWACDTWA